MQFYLKIAFDKNLNVIFSLHFLRKLRINRYFFVSKALFTKTQRIRELLEHITDVLKSRLPKNIISLMHQRNIKK